MWSLDNIWLLILIVVFIAFLEIKRLRKILDENKNANNATFRVCEAELALVLWIQEYKAYDLSHPEANLLVQHYISSLEEYAHHYPQVEECVNEQAIKLMRLAKMPLQ